MYSVNVLHCNVAKDNCVEIDRDTSHDVLYLALVLNLTRTVRVLKYVYETNKSTAATNNANRW